ncbi:hypothetical protein Btru_008023 [Bulinus truncatus]|nr:hypothetical protein Btru_008023 [Bulinus truncatus]
MTGQTTAAKGPPAAQAGDASEDGDFVALRESREVRVPETLDLSQSILETILAVAKEVRPQSAHQRPFTGITRRKTTLGQDDHWTQLIDAANSGTTAFSNAVLRIHTSNKLSNKDVHDPVTGQNILHYTVELKSQDLISVVLEVADNELLSQPFDVEVAKIIGKKNVFHQVVEQNNLQLLKTLLAKLSQVKRVELLNKETPVEIIGQRPRTFPCLHLAAYYGYTDIVEFILSQGIDVNHLNAKNDTSLLWASRWGHQTTVRSLLKLGALPSIENDKGSTALYWAVRYGFAETVEILAREGKANVSQTRKLGLVAPIVLASALGFDKIVSILLEFGADPNFAIRGGERPIHHAAREGFAHIIEVLVSKGAKVDAADERGDTALLLTAKHGRPKSMQTLLQLGANVHHKNLMGDDVWTFAVNSDNDLILKLLVIHQRRQEIENLDIIDTKPLSSGSNSLLHLAAWVGNIEKIKLLLELKIDASATDEAGNNFLHHAAINNQAQVIKEFHKLVNIDMANKVGNTALHEACIKGHHEAIMELIQCKALANIRNSQGETALHVAANSKDIQPNSVSRLMEYIIKTHPWEVLNITDNLGNNPLHIAAKFARPEVLWEFRFVRFKDPDVEGNIALHEAVSLKKEGTEELGRNIYCIKRTDNWYLS